MSDAYFKAIDVWRRVDQSTLVCYRCFHVPSRNSYCVQSADFYRVPFDPQSVAALEQQFLELLVEQLPSERADLFDTLEAAIKRHDQEFA